MALPSTTWFWTALALSILVPLTYLALLRRVEKYGRESWKPVLSSFAAGLLVAYPVALLIERVFVWAAPVDGARGANLVVVAPIVEELLKALCVALFWKRFTEPADGVVYGAGVGFGFAAIENAGYALRVSGDSGAWTALLLTANRVVTASVVHALLTGLVGLSLALRRSRQTSPLWILLAFAFAVGVHSAYNWFNTIVEEGRVQAWVGGPIALAFWALVPAAALGLRRLDGRARKAPAPAHGSSR